MEQYEGVLKLVKVSNPDGSSLWYLMEVVDGGSNVLHEIGRYGAMMEMLQSWGWTGDSPEGNPYTEGIVTITSDGLATRLGDRRMEMGAVYSPGATITPTTTDPGDGDDGDVTYDGVLRGGEIIKVSREGGVGPMWVAMYELPPGSGRYVAYQFDDRDQVEATFGPDWRDRVSDTVGETWFNDNVTMVGTADEIVGMVGTWERYYTEMIDEAAAAAGVYDPTLQGMVANDPEWQRILFMAAEGEWTEAQQLAELRKTDLWQNVLYPGIANLYAGTSEPEVAYENYSRAVEASLESLGYSRDEDGTYKTTIGQMLDLQVSDDLFNEGAQYFARAMESPEYFDAMNMWAQQELGKSITFDDWFELLAGEAGHELQEVYEKAILQYQSEATGLLIEQGLLSRIGDATDMSEQEMQQRMNTIEKQLLAIGDEKLLQFELSRQDMIEAGMGISTTSGRSHEWIQRQSAKAAFELGMSDDFETGLFMGFHSRRGTPERPGLTMLTPEEG